MPISNHVFAVACRSYDVAFKLKAIAAAEGGSKQATARQFKIDAKRVREWCSQKEKLMALKKGEDMKQATSRSRTKAAGQ